MRPAVLLVLLSILPPLSGHAALVSSAERLGDEDAVAGLAEVRRGKAALDAADAKLDSRLRGVRGLRSRRGLRDASREVGTWRRRDGRVRVLARLDRLDDAARSALGMAGLTIERERPQGRVVEGLIHTAALRALAEVDGVRSVRPADPGQTRAGRFATGGDSAARADLARTLGFDGAGVRVGVISDGIDGLGASQASGDLGAVTVPAGCSAGSGSEGRAMLEIVHDLAPGAELLFASGVDSPLTFVEAVECLTAAGALVIVDDLGFFGEPYFEDGIIAQAVRAAVQQAGVSYHTAAGNSALLHYEAPFRAAADSKFHDFSDGGGIDNLNTVVIPSGGSLLCVLQWENPFGAADDDYNLLLFDQNRDLAAASETKQNGRGDPIEIVVARNDGATAEVAGLAIERERGAARTVELFCVRDTDTLEHVTPGASIFGHAAVAEAIAVAAIDVDDPGLDSVERFSSQGPARIAFPQSETRAKPDLTGFDGVTTGVPGFAPFFGTSAAAPHVAAIAALLLQRNPFLTPAEVGATLAATAVDLGAPGPDDVSGAGRVDAFAAVNAVAPPECFADADCDDADLCTTDRCVRGRCAPSPALCDDGNPCNGLERCLPETGTCVAGAQAPDGTPCPDGTVCNGDETCAAGACAEGPPLVCGDGDTCTDDACAPEAGCQFVALAGPASVACVLERGLPACPGIELPASVRRRFARAGRLITRSETARRRTTQRRLVRRAGRALARALVAVDRASLRLPTDCTRSLVDSLGAARARARAVAQSLR